MSINGEIARIKDNIASSYTVLESKGAVIPETRNSANLSAAVGSLPSAAEKMDLMPYISTSAERQALSNGQLFKYQGEYCVTDETAAQDYAALAKKSDIPTVPTAISQLTNDSGFQTGAQVQTAAAAAASSAVNGIPALTLQITYDDDSTATVNLLTRASV